MQKIWKKEKTLCTFIQNNTKLQLVKIIFGTRVQFAGSIGEVSQIENYTKYQVRLNRKIIETSISEYHLRKVFATYCQNIVLQLKIY